MIKRIYSLFAVGLLAACASQQPPDPVVTAKIIAICTHSGFFKVAGGVIETLYPVAVLPLSIINAGIDQVCMHPEKFSSDASTIEWLLRNMPGQTTKSSSAC